MNTLKKIGVAILVLLFGASGGAAFGGVYSNVAKDFSEGISVDGTTVIDGQRGASFATTSAESFTSGGNACAITDANGGTYTLSAAELASCGTLELTASGAGQEVVALTSVATSSLTSIPNAGDCKEYTYDADAVAAATTTTFTAAAGFHLIAYTTNDDVIDGNEFATMKMCRRADTDVNWFVSELVHSD
jgi:hypothetical protein